MLDNVDIRILECLKHNSRENASVIGSKVNMSVSAVIERIKKLESSGIIKQYTTVLDEEKLGYSVQALVFINLDFHDRGKTFLEFCKKHPQVIECVSVAGDYDVQLKVCAAHTADLEKLLSEIRALNGVKDTSANMILSTYKQNFSPDITEN